MYQSTASISRMVQESIELSDAHCHLNLYENPKAALQESISHGMRLVLATGGSMKDNLEVSMLCQNDIVFGIIGISPDFAHKEADQVKELEKMIKANHKIIGIGEIGLDAKASRSEQDFEVQKKVFEAQLEIAREMNLPVVIHSRGTLEQVLELLAKHNISRAMFHFFEGNGADAKEIEARGYIMSVPPVENKNRKQAIREIDVRKIVVETDSPVVGKHMLDVKKSLEMISKIKGMEVSELAAITTNNLREFFYI